MSDKKEKILYAAVKRLLTPLVRLLLRNGIPHAVFAELARKVYVDVAQKDFTVPGKKQTDTRISTLTGLTRKDVARLKKQNDEDERYSLQGQHRVARVIYGWVNDEKYATSKGNTKTLSFDQGKTNFSTLVKEYSGDMTPRAIYDELLQKGVIKVDDAGQIHLLERAFIPTTSEIEKLKILGVDVSGLIATIDRNIYETERDPFFQRKVYYDNVPDEAIPIIKKLIAKRSQLLLEDINQVMAQHDRDSNPNAEGSGRNALGVGIFYFENEDDEAR